MLKENVTGKIINLSLIHQIEESNSYVRILHNQIKFYQTEIDFLNNNKPLFFQKRKLEKHNKKIDEYGKKISNIYIKLEKEINLLGKLYSKLI